jgi:hypothetical protein
LEFVSGPLLLVGDAHKVKKSVPVVAWQFWEHSIFAWYLFVSSEAKRVSVFQGRRGARKGGAAACTGRALEVLLVGSTTKVHFSVHLFSIFACNKIIFCASRRGSAADGTLSRTEARAVVAEPLQEEHKNAKSSARLTNRSSNRLFAIFTKAYDLKLFCKSKMEKIKPEKR